METLEKIKELTEILSVDSTKFFKGNKSAVVWHDETDSWVIF